MSLRTLLLVLALLALACFLFVRFDSSTVGEEERTEIRVGLPGHPWLARTHTVRGAASPERLAEMLREAGEGLEGESVEVTLGGSELRTTTIDFFSPSWLALLAAAVLLIVRWRLPRSQAGSSGQR